MPSQGSPLWPKSSACLSCSPLPPPPASKMSPSPMVPPLLTLLALTLPPYLPHPQPRRIMYATSFPIESNSQWEPHPKEEGSATSNSTGRKTLPSHSLSSIVRNQMAILCCKYHPRARVHFPCPPCRPSQERHKIPKAAYILPYPSQPTQNPSLSLSSPNPISKHNANIPPPSASSPSTPGR